MEFSKTMLMLQYVVSLIPLDRILYLGKCNIK